MKRPRPTVQRLNLLIALIAVGLAIYREFDQGLPPRFVIREIPARVAKLKPGMTMTQVREILGLDRPWYRGGLIPNCHIYATNDGELFADSCYLGKYSFFENSRSNLIIFMHVRQTGQSSVSSDMYESAILEAVDFISEGQTIARMPDVKH